MNRRDFFLVLPFVATLLRRRPSSLGDHKELLDSVPESGVPSRSVARMTPADGVTGEGPWVTVGYRPKRFHFEGDVVVVDEADEHSLPWDELDRRLADPRVRRLAPDP